MVEGWDCKLLAQLNLLCLTEGYLPWQIVQDLRSRWVLLMAN